MPVAQALIRIRALLRPIPAKSRATRLVASGPLVRPLLRATIELDIALHCSISVPGCANLARICPNTGWLRSNSPEFWHDNGQLWPEFGKHGPKLPKVEARKRPTLVEFDQALLHVRRTRADDHPEAMTEHHSVVAGPFGGLVRRQSSVGFLWSSVGVGTTLDAICASMPSPPRSRPRP